MYFGNRCQTTLIPMCIILAFTSLFLSHTHTHTSHLSHVTPSQILSTVTFTHTPTHTHTQLEDVALVYYRREDNDMKYLDSDATIGELVADFNLICDK